MPTLGPYDVHPFASEFPLLEGEAFAELVSDIKRHGLREPIVLTGDRKVIVDGRNRYRACEVAGVAPSFTVLPEGYGEAEILDLIVSKNVTRRHLNTGQRAMLALRYEEMYARVTRRGRPRHDTAADTPGEEIPLDLEEFSGSRLQRESTAKAARAVGVSRSAVAQAKAVQRDAPDLAEQVRAGQIALDAAYKQARERAKATPRPASTPAKPGPVLITLRTHTGDPVPYPRPQGKATFNLTQGDGISWATWSWNPVTGCLHGCDYCYAREIATSERFKTSFPAGFTPLFHEERLDAPANTTIPEQHRNDPAWRRVFVCSMADLYGRWVPDEWIHKVHDAMLTNPQWQYILLTKFPARYLTVDLPPGAWVGTSVDTQQRVRIAEDAFRQINNVAVKWLSLEPLKEPLEFTDLSMFDWVVIGAQTETRQPSGVVPAFAPPAEWVVRITYQALEAGCKVHWKPNLRTSPGMRWLDQYPVGSGREVP